MAIPSNANFDTELAKNVRPLVHLFEIDSYPRSFITYDMSQANQYPWIHTIQIHSQSANVLAGTSKLGDLVVQVIDKDRTILGDFPVVLEGKTARLKTGFRALSQGDFVTTFTGIVDRVELDRDNLIWTFVCKPKELVTKKLIYTLGDSGELIASDNPKTIIGNPMDILNSQVWQTEVGLAAGDIDVAKITSYKDSLFAGFEMEFSLTSAPQAKAFLDKEIFKALGGYSYTKADGDLSVRFMWPLPGTIASELTLTDQNLLRLPTPGESGLINVVSHRFDRVGNEFRAESNEKFTSSIAKFGVEGHHIIESAGMRSSLQAFSMARVIARGIFALFSDKNLRISGAETFWTAVLLEIGDFVKVTHDLIPDRSDGTLGITENLFWVTKVVRDYMKGRIRLDLLDASQIGAATSNFRKWAPNGTPEYTSQTAQEKADYLSICDDATGQFSDNDPGHPLA